MDETTEEDEGPSISGFGKFLLKGVQSVTDTVKSYVSPVLGLGSNRRQDDLSKRSKIYFDIDINGQYAGRIKMELFNEVVPNTAENFRALATGKSAYNVVRCRMLECTVR